MEKFSFFGALVLLILVQSPFIFSYSCNDTPNEIQETCLDIYNSDLNYSEKQLLISNLEYKNKFEPNHFLIYSRNSNIQIKDAPFGIQTYDDKYIQDAWMKIFTLMPSVIYQDALYVPKNTKVLIGFSFDFDKPIDYKSPRYRKTKNGDCRTRYRLLEKKEENKIYVNNIYQGQGKLVQITINQNSKVESVYKIKIKYDVNHYKWDRYCCKRRDGRCVKHCYDCDYNYDETKTGQITIKDSINVKIYENDLIANVLEITRVPYSTRLNLDYSDSVEVSFVDSKYNYYKYLFEFVNSFPPYNLLTLKATDYNLETSTNLFKEENSLIVNNIARCTIKGFDFFNELENRCLSKNDFIDLRIKTNKLKYYNGEEINVNIFPKNISVNLTYAGKSS